MDYAMFEKRRHEFLGDSMQATQLQRDWIRDRFYGEVVAALRQRGSLTSRDMLVARNTSFDYAEKAFDTWGLMPLEGNHVKNVLDSVISQTG